MPRGTGPVSLRAVLTAAGRKVLRWIRRPAVVLVEVVVLLVVTGFLITTVGRGLADTAPFRFALVDNDGGPAAAGFLASLTDLEEVGAVVVIHAEGNDEAHRLVDEGKADAGFLIPVGLSAAAEERQPALLSVLTAPGSGLGGHVARSIAESYAVELNAVQLSVASALAVEGDVSPERQRSLVASAEAGRRLIKLQQEDHTETTAAAFGFVALSVSYVFLLLFMQLLLIWVCPGARLATILFAGGSGVGAMTLLWVATGASASQIVLAGLVCLGLGVLTGWLGRLTRRGRYPGDPDLRRCVVVVGTCAVALVGVAALALANLSAVDPQPRIGVVNRDTGVLGVALVRGIEELDGVAVTRFAAADEARQAVDRGEIDAAVILAYDHTPRLRNTYTATVRYVSTDTPNGFEALPLVAAVIDDQSVRARAARFTAAETGATFDEAVIVVGRVADTIEGVTVEVTQH